MLVARLWIEGDAAADHGWQLNESVALPEHAVRHIQVLRMQPGDALRLFNGDGSEWHAEVVHMGRRDATVRLLRQEQPLARELSAAVTLAVGMPANDRMDALIEKATELGVHAVQPLVCARSVLRLDGDRAIKKVAHWQSVAVAACEQSGRTRVPLIKPVRSFQQWLPHWQSTPAMRGGVLSFAPQQSVHAWVSSELNGNAMPATSEVLFLNGPEGGLSSEEEALARQHGMVAIGLGPRVLRADTAPLMALSVVAAWCER